MRSKQTYAIAASLAVVGLALPATLYHLKQSASFRPLSVEPPASQPVATVIAPSANSTDAAASKAAIALQERHRREQIAQQSIAQPMTDALRRAEVDAKAKDEAAKKVVEGPLGTLRADTATSSSPPAGGEQTVRFGAGTKFEDGRANEAAGGRKAKPAEAVVEAKTDDGSTGTRRVATVPLDKEGRAQGGSTGESAPSVSGVAVAAPAPAAAPEPITPGPIASGHVRQMFAAKERHTDPSGQPLPAKVAPTAQHALILPPHDQPPPRVEDGHDRFAAAEPSPFKQVATEPVSTFSVDVDTASYAFVRRALNAGRLPPREAVRIEEMINYFPYTYPAPESAKTPFQPTITVVPSPWHAERKLVHVALKGYALNAAERPRANLVLLVDVSGSMGPADRLPLLKSGFRMLVENLKADDTVAIVTYANNTRVALEPTKALDKGRILQVIDSLQAGGGTYGEGGLQRAYALAEAGFDKSAVNRVVLATDGDFNIGIADHTQLKSYIEGKRQTGIFLSVLGVGLSHSMGGNHNDRLMQALAQNGNGVAAYIDTLSEARKVLIEEASSSLFPIAKDVKIQVEFNPASVREYRLVGYETRALKREDFNNDKVDAGDVGSGHTVTALYEVVPVGAKSRSIDDLRYATTERTRREPLATAGKDGEYGFFKLRYKLPAEATSRLLELPITQALEQSTLAAAPVDVRFGVAVASFGQLLQGGKETGAFTWDQAIDLANGARGDDPFGYRAEMVNLMRLAKSLPR